MDLYNYILINDFVASEIPPSKGNLAMLCQENDYVIEKWRQNTIGANFHFVYKIYVKGIQQNHISIGNWRIEDIHTYSKWVPKELVFNLVDPTGRSSNDRAYSYTFINRGSWPSLAVPFTNYKAFDRLFSLAKEADKHDRWLPFLLEKTKSNLEKITSWSRGSTYEIEKLEKAIQGFQKMIDEENMI